jgi:ribonuclease inhibitor
MRTVTIDCAGIQSEAEFWERYLRSTDAEGAGYFGRNLDAFWDALNGGPGWPGECELRFSNTAQMAQFRSGNFLRALQRIAEESDLVRVALS